MAPSWEKQVGSLRGAGGPGEAFDGSLLMAVPVICPSCPSPQWPPCFHPSQCPKSSTAAGESYKLQTCPCRCSKPTNGSLLPSGYNPRPRACCSQPPAWGICGSPTVTGSPSSSFLCRLQLHRFLGSSCTSLCFRICCSLSLEFPQVSELSSNSDASTEAGLWGRSWARLLAGSALALG